MAASGLRAKFRQRKSIPVLVLSLAAIAFLIRGPFRALTGSDLNDLISPYVQSLAFIRGADPYSPQSLLENWPKQALACRPEEREFEDGSILVRHGIPTAYPLTAFLLIAPLTFLPWPAFKCLAVILSVLLFVAAVW